MALKFMKDEHFLNHLTDCQCALYLTLFVCLKGCREQNCTHSITVNFFLQAEIGALHRTQEDLQKGKQTLEDMLERLEREQVGLSKLDSP